MLDLPSRDLPNRAALLALVLTFMPGAYSQQNQFQGSVPAGAASSTPISLTLAGAIQRGLANNLGVLTRDTESQSMRAQRLHALAALMPQVDASLSETSQQVNLKALGLNFQAPPGSPFSIPSIVGPFGVSDARATVSATLFDYSLIQKLKSAKTGVLAAELSVQDGRDIVVQAVANGYLEIISDDSRVSSIRAQVATAQALYGRASDQKNAGLSPAIDVLRAQVELKRQEQRLLAQQNLFAKDKLALGRVIGLPPGQDFNLAESAPFSPLAAMTPEDGVRTALGKRADYRSAQMLARAADESVKAAQAERYPTLGFSGFYGADGPRPDNSHGDFSAAATLRFNIFNGGRIQSDVDQARATLKQRQDELADLGGQIDYQVRAALLDIQSAADQVAVAQTNVDLANQTLDQAKDRFAAGVTDNIEVVQAQDSVATANDNLISALYAHNIAKVALAKALGAADQGIDKFIEVK